MPRSADDKKPAADRSGADRLLVGSVAKCFRILEVMSGADRPLTLTDIARRVELGKSAVQRLTHTLRVLGYLRQHPETRAYSLSAKLLGFTHSVLAQDRVRAVALPLLDELNRQCGETVNLTRLEERIGKSIRSRLRCTARFGHSRAPWSRFDGAQCSLCRPTSRYW